jgi:hypothetical protein
MAKYGTRAFGGTFIYNDMSSYMPLVGYQPVFAEAGSLSVDSTVGKRSQAAMTLYTDPPVHFQQHQQVSVYDNTTSLIFSGYIMQPKESKPGFAPALEHAITCADQHFLADKRRIAASFANQTPAQIAKWIQQNILAQEGVTVGQIFDPNPALYCSPTTIVSTTLFVLSTSGTIPNAVFAYCTASEALDALTKAASSSGIPYYWQIDQFKQFWFVPYTAIVNSALVDGTQIDDGTLSGNLPTVTRANPTYRNTQYILGGTAQTTTQIETRVGDGNAQAWAMSYDLSSAPIVTVNGGTTRTVGLKGATGFQFYWQPGDPIITQDSGQGKLSASDTLQITYVGQFPLVASDNNAAQVAYEATLDGTTGIIEEVAQDASITSLSGGYTEASNLLTRYAQQGVQFQFSTLTPGFAQGQLITVNYPPLGLYNAQMLIESVNASDQNDGYNIWYTVNAVQGPYDTTWVDFFGSLLQTPQPQANLNVGVSQSVALLVSAPVSLSLTVSMTVTVYACPIVSTSLLCNTTVIVC